MSTSAGALLWNRLHLTLASGVSEVDTGLTQVNKTFADQSPGEPPLGVTSTTPPAGGTAPASRVQVIPLVPTVAWTNIVHGEPYFNPTTGTVWVSFQNNDKTPVILNVLFWDPFALLGPGDADTYQAFCFAPNTLVWTPAGALPISTLREGDLVLAWDGERPQARKVMKVHKHVADHRRVIETGDGTRIETTDNHPFMVGGRWAPIGGLVVGDVIADRNGTIALTRSERIEGETEVLNIEVDDLHTYLVGPSALVVHNK